MAADENAVRTRHLTFGEFRLDCNLKRLYRGTQSVKLSPKPFSTLEFLISNRERVVSKQELLSSVWREQRDQNTVDQAVGKLRKALGDAVARPQYIETIPGQGYHFIATVLTHDTLAEEDTVSEHASLSARAVSPLADTLEETFSLDTRAAANTDHASLSASAKIRWRTATILAGSLAVVALAALFVFRPAHTPNPQRATVVGTKLTAFDDAGHAIWRYQFPGPLLPIAAGSNFDLSQNSETYVQDLNGDGKNEVLVAASHGVKDESSDELYCFAANGRLLWHYQPHADFSFVGRKASGPWKLRTLMIVTEATSRAVWAAFSDPVFAPTLVASVDAVGHAQIRFVSSGNVNDMTNVVTQQGTFILAGGINNEYRTASLAILDSHQPPAASPQTPGNRFECLNCPSGRPLRYVLLPRSEVNVGSGMPYNWVTSLYRRGGTIAVSTMEQSPGITELIELSGDLVPKNISFGAGYREAHERLEQLGRIDHKWADCEEQKHPAIARIWDSHGRHEIPIPWVH